MTVAAEDEEEQDCDSSVMLKGRSKEEVEEER